MSELRDLVKKQVDRTELQKKLTAWVKEKADAYGRQLVTVLEAGPLVEMAPYLSGGDAIVYLDTMEYCDRDDEFAYQPDEDEEGKGRGHYIMNRTSRFYVRSEMTDDEFIGLAHEAFLASRSCGIV